MKDERSAAVTNAVEAISDGKPVDWDSAMTKHPEISPLLENLRDIESLMRTFDTATEAETATPAPAPDEYVAQWGHLRKLRFIGEGAFGKVYRAFDPMLEQDVALKLWNKSVNGMELDITHMLSEARKLARVRHRNVLVVHGADRHDDRAGMWTDFIEGETLEAQLQKVGKFSAHEAIAVGVDLCRALAAMHAAGLMHRDVKTLNVMRTHKGDIVLMDFGSVGELSKSGMLKSSTIRGTPLTMSPEHLREEAVGPTADLYSLGVLLYHLVTGEYPVEARNIEELSYKHVSGGAVPLLDRRPELPSAFVRVAEKAMAADPSERYQSAGAMEKALVAALAEPAPEPELPHAPSPPAPVPDRKDWWSRLRAAWAWLVARPARWATATSVLIAVVAAPWLIPSPALTVEATLYRETADGAERLLPGARIAPGNALWLEIEGSRAMHVYVFNEDEAGAAYALFPNEQFDTHNPLLPGREHRLPGTSRGRPANWRVSNAAGRETYFVIASTKPQEDLDQLIIKLRSTKDVVFASRPLQPVLDKLPKAPADPWVWRIDLENPPEGG